MNNSNFFHNTKIVKNILLYFSAFVPLYILIVVKFVLGFISGTIELYALTIFTISIYSLMIIIGIFGLLLSTIWQKEQIEKITIKTEKNITDQHFLGYFALFVLFALGFQLTRLSMVIDSFLVIIFIGIVYVNNQMFYINPFLNLLGYNFYEITYKKEADEKIYSAKMFYKGKLDLQKKKTFNAKTKNVNFVFINKK